MSSGGGYQHEISPARELDVAHGRFGSVIPEIGPHRMAGDGLEDGGSHHARGTGRHHHTHLRARILQAPDEVGAFVGGNAARDAEDNPLLA